MKRLVAVAGVLVCAVAVLVWVGIVEASIPVLRLSQLGAGYEGGTVQLDGGKVREIQSHTPLVFTIYQDGDPSSVIRVESERLAPQNLRKDIPVSLRGTYDANRNVFTAYGIAGFMGATMVQAFVTAFGSYMVLFIVMGIMSLVAAAISFVFKPPESAPAGTPAAKVVPPPSAPLEPKPE